jgi:hypothetical protein
LEVWTVCRDIILKSEDHLTKQMALSLMKSRVASYSRALVTVDEELRLTCEEFDQLKQFLDSLVLSGLTP